MPAIKGIDLVKNRLALQQIHATFDKWLWLPNYWMIDVFCATIMCNWLEGLPPVWLMIVAPPATGKTVFIESLDALPMVYPVSGLSENSIVSGMVPSRRQREGGDRNRAVGLLERMSDTRDYEEGMFIANGTKFLCIKDMTSLVSGRSEVRGKVLSQLRELYDEKLNWEWGSRHLEFHGKVAVIAGCTNVWDRHMLEGNNLGERFLYWRIPRGYGKQATLAAMQQQDRGLMRKELRDAIALLSHLKLPRAVDTQSIQNWLVELATRTAVMRTEFTRDKRQNLPDEPARFESGARLGLQFEVLTKGLMLVKGIDDPNTNDIKYPLVRVAMSSIPLTRLDIFCKIDPNGESTDSLRDKVNMPRTNLGRHITDMCTLGILYKLTTHETAVHPDWHDWHKKFSLVYKMMMEEAGETV